jgi:tellurium resistance protein TerZ
LKKAMAVSCKILCVGINWGAIEKKGCLVSVAKKRRLTLTPAVLYLTKEKLQEVVYFGNLKAKMVQ